MNQPDQPHPTPRPVEESEDTAACRATAELVAVRQRLDWLFRHAQPSPAMNELRAMVQRYREGNTP